MSFDAHKNFAYARVKTPPTPATSGATLILGTGQGALMPTPPFNATVWPSGAQPGQPAGTVNMEIIRVTARPGGADTFTILRAQEGTTARAIVVGDQIAETITAKTLTDVEAAVTQETSDRAAAVSAEASTRAAADTAETAARIAADSTEASARAAADTSEATTRAAADTAETSARVAADSAEATARVAGDALAAQKASNLSDLASASTARTNLGLGSAATHPSTDFDAAGAAAAEQTRAQAAESSEATTRAAAVTAEAAARTAADALLTPLTDARLTDQRTPIDNSVTSAKIVDGAIVNADVNAAAAIAATKIAGTAVTQADTGTVSSAMITDGTIIDADINSGAAIKVTKIAPRPGLFHVDDYPITGGDPADYATSLRAAIADCVSQGGGLVQLSDKTYTLNTAQGNACAYINGDDRGFPFKIAGRGKGVTILKYGSAVSTLIGANPQSAHVTLSPIDLEDFTVDCGTSSTSNKAYLVFYSASAGANTFSTTGRHHIKRVDSMKCGHSAGTERGPVKWIINRSSIAAALADPCTLTGLVIEDCYFGVAGGSSGTQGGGIMGVNVGGFVNAGGGDKDGNGRFKPSKLYGLVQNAANVIVDDIVIDNMSHWSGSEPDDTTAGGEPIHLGGDGIVKWCRIRGGVLRNSGDIGIELDGIIDGVVEGVSLRNCDGNNVLILPFGSGTLTDEWNCVVRDVEAIWEAVDEAGTATPSGGSPAGGAFCSNTRFGGGYDGTLLWENCTARYESLIDQAANMFILGPARKQVVRDCRAIITGTQVSDGSSKNVSGLVVRASGRPQTLIVDGFRVDRKAALDNAKAVDYWVNISTASDLNLQVKNLGGSSSGAQANGAQRFVRPVNLSVGGNDPTDTFTTDLLDSDFLFDLGASSDYTYDSTNHWYTANANLSTEKRAIFVATNTDTSSENLVGKAKDGSHYSLMKTGTVRAAYKGGAFAKRRDVATFLAGYTFDDGAQSYLCLDKTMLVTVTAANPAVFSTSFAHGLTAGTPIRFQSTGTLPAGVSANTTYFVIAAGLTATAFEVSATLAGASITTSDTGSGTHNLRVSLLPAAGAAATGANGAGSLTVTNISTPAAYTSDRGIVLATRLATSTTHYPSIVVQGNTVTAEHWLSAEPGNAGTRPAGAGDAWVSATLTGSDITVYGGRVSGEFGFVQVPINTAALVGKMVHRRLHVVSGKIDGVLVGGLDAAAGGASGVYIQPTFASKLRIDGQLELVSSDLRNLATALSTVTDVDALAGTTAITQQLLRSRNQYANAVADVTVTLGASPAVWQNTTGQSALLALSGQVTTKLELSKDGTTYRDVAGSGLLRVPPNWYTRVTYPGSAPTATALLED